MEYSEHCQLFVLSPTSEVVQVVQNTVVCVSHSHPLPHYAHTVLHARYYEIQWALQSVNLGKCAGLPQLSIPHWLYTRLPGLALSEEKAHASRHICTVGQNYQGPIQRWHIHYTDAMAGALLASFHNPPSNSSMWDWVILPVQYDSKKAVSKRVACCTAYALGCCYCHTTLDPVKVVIVIKVCRVTTSTPLGAYECEAI